MKHRSTPSSRKMCPVGTLLKEILATLP